MLTPGAPRGMAGPQVEKLASLRAQQASKKMHSEAPSRAMWPARTPAGMERACRASHGMHVIGQRMHFKPLAAPATDVSTPPVVLVHSSDGQDAGSHKRVGHVCTRVALGGAGHVQPIVACCCNKQAALVADVLLDGVTHGPAGCSNPGQAAAARQQQQSCGCALAGCSHTWRLMAAIHAWLKGCNLAGRGRQAAVVPQEPASGALTWRRRPTSPLQQQCGSKSIVSMQFKSVLSGSKTQPPGGGGVRVLLCGTPGHPSTLWAWKQAHTEAGTTHRNDSPPSGRQQLPRA